MSTEIPEAIETTGTFGNYLIHGIDEIILPQAISWWPTAPGWQVLGTLILLLLFLQLGRTARRWWQNRYRREALRQLDSVPEDSRLASLPYYIKVSALHAYPRQDVACLSGAKWLAFLDSHYDGPSFSTGVGKKLLAISYLPTEQWQLSDQEGAALIRMSRRWISKHRVATSV
jgi:hypothetical protein